MTHRAHTVLLAAPDDPDMVEHARAYISRYALTFDDVRLVRTEGMILVRTKREVQLSDAI